MAHEVRESLKPHVGKRIQVRGMLEKFEQWMHRGRQSLRACILSPEVDAKVVGHHVWVINCKHWNELRSRVGETVVFEAVVDAYLDQALGKTNYCLINADMPEFLNFPALKVPPPIKEPLKGGVNGHDRPNLDQLFQKAHQQEKLEHVRSVLHKKEPKREETSEGEARSSDATAAAASVTEARAVSMKPDLVEPAEPYRPVVTFGAPAGVAMLKLAKRFVKVCGDSARARELLAFLRDQPRFDPADLLVWVEELANEE